jgi:phosphomannomutase
MFAAAALAGLLAAGCEVTELGIVMTPTIARAIRDGAYDGGVVITASHNPPPWNGVKFLDNRGVAPSPEHAREIAAIRAQRHFRSQKDGFHLVRSDNAAGERHVEAVLDAVEVDLAPIRGLRVVLDSVNGAGGLDSPALLAGLGCNVIPLNGEPTGQFAHPPEPIAENLTQLCDAVRQAEAAIGFAQDPDADRLAIVDERGSYVGEEYTLALAAWSVLLHRPGPVAANLSTSRLVDAIAERFGVPVIRTPVGESNVAHAMLDNRCVIGGEGNGGVIDPRISLVRDSLSAMSLVLQLMATTGKRLSQLVADLPRYVMIKQKYDCPRERIDAAITAVASAFADQRVNRADGARVDFPQGWVHLRASNTEPVARLIAEAGDDTTAQALLARVRTAAGLQASA